MAASLYAEMEATCAFSTLLSIRLEMARMASKATRIPRSRPRLRSTALAPAVTLRTPSAKMECARSVAVVVLSPTASLVFSDACRIIWAPSCSTESLNSNSLAMVTPSLHTIGVPHFLAISTHLDFGPSVTRTASVRAEAPRKTFSRASALNSTCLYDITLSPPFSIFRARNHRGLCPRPDSAEGP